MLLARAAAGHADAFSQLRNRHSMSLYALAYGIVIDAVDAQEIVDATFAGSRVAASRRWLGQRRGVAGQLIY